ncbi:MAG: FG-GAP-like repeat-containing protein [Rhodospirillales bacterium]
MRYCVLSLLLTASLFAAGDVLIVADEFPAMQILAARLKAGAGVDSSIVRQAEMPSDLSRFAAVIVYIHGAIGEPAEKAFIDYAEAGGKLILLHHSISSGKRPNRYWLPFLGVSLPLGDLSHGGYTYFEDIEMEIVNLAPNHFITTRDVNYSSKISYKSPDFGGMEKLLPGFTLSESEVYLNHVLEGDRTILLGLKFREPKSGAIYMQDTAGWYKRAGRGIVMFFMPGHSEREFENPAYSQILVNAVAFQPARAEAPASPTGVAWQHLSTKAGDLEIPNSGGQQTSSVVFDADKDGVDDFAITERTAAPSVVLYRRRPAGWTRYVIDAGPLRIEAGSCAWDIDGDGDLDLVAGGDAGSNQVWWWENPHPEFDPKVPWKRHLIKNSGSTKHHDQLFGDFDGDGKDELVFWNQGARTLFLARIPDNPRTTDSWPLTPIYTYSGDSEPQQRGKPASFRSVNEHEGLAKADIDGDGRPDIVGGGRWFKHLGGDRFQPNLIDASYSFSRAAAGQLKKGGRPEVVLVVGDGRGPLNWYEWVNGTWEAHKLLDVENGHSLDLVDFDGDGNLDIFLAEMRLGGGNPEAKIYVLLGDGRGNFKTTVVASGFGNHESKIADLDGNGTLDILGKPYDWEAPRLDLWLNFGKAK